MTKEIKSASNPFIKQLRALMNSKKARQESGLFLVEGWRSVQTLIEHPSGQYALKQLVVSDSWNQGPLPKEIDTIRIPDAVFSRISDVCSAQGILGVVRQQPAPAELPSSGNLLLLDNLRDPGNLGTLMRSAVGAGFDGILLHGECVEPSNPKVVRASMGTFAFARIWSVDQRDIEQLTRCGFKLYATTGSDGNNLYETAFGSKTILAVGSEANGLSEQIMKLAEMRITIPLAIECESLNAAVAGSICMFHIAHAFASHRRSG